MLFALSSSNNNSGETQGAGQLVDLACTNIAAYSFESLTNIKQSQEDKQTP
jgi:hypothetical protein